MKEGCDPSELLKALRWKAGQVVVSSAILLSPKRYIRVCPITEIT